MNYNNDYCEVERTDKAAKEYLADALRAIGDAFDIKCRDE